MKIHYSMYHISGTTGNQIVFEQGELVVPENGHGIRCNLRRMFPTFCISRQTVGNEDFRMHNADWTTGIAITVR